MSGHHTAQGTANTPSSVPLAAMKLRGGGLPAYRYRGAPSTVPVSSIDEGSVQQLLRHPLVRELTLENERLAHGMQSVCRLTRELRKFEIATVAQAEALARSNIMSDAFRGRSAIALAAYRYAVGRIIVVEADNRILEEVNLELEGCMANAQENISATPQLGLSVYRRLSTSSAATVGRTSTPLLSHSTGNDRDPLQGGGCDGISSAAGCESSCNVSSRKRPRGGISTTRPGDGGSAPQSPADLIKERRTIIVGSATEKSKPGPADAYR